MTIKKTQKTAKTNATEKKPVKKVVKEPKEHIVTEKLESIMDQTKTESSIIGQQPLSEKPARGSFPWWGVISVVLILVFASIVLYQNNNDFRGNIGKVLNMVGLVKTPVDTGTVKVAKGDPFEMKLGIVYDQSDAKMKTNIDSYIANIENNLDNTEVKATWMDKNSPEGLAMIKQVGAKFIPIFTTDQTILKHPQYSLFSQAMTQIDDVYQFRSEGMQYLTVPPVADARVIGADPEKAKVKIIEYSSMTCEYCKQMHPVLLKLAQKYSKDISLVVKNYDRGGIDTVFEQGVECAGDQGRFDKMITDLYDRQDEVFKALQATKDMQGETYNQIKISAKNIGANADNVLACVKSGKYADKIAKQTAEGLEYGIIGTPGIFVNKQFIGGAMEEASFTKLVEDELNKK